MFRLQVCLILRRMRRRRSGHKGIEEMDKIEIVKTDVVVRCRNEIHESLMMTGNSVTRITILWKLHFSGIVRIARIPPLEEDLLYLMVLLLRRTFFWGG